MTEKRLERRLAAILAADVVGYSRLMGADEEGTLARLKELRFDLIDRKIAEHHGRIVKTTGDGLLVEFGSVVDAVRCAVETQRDMVMRNEGLPEERWIQLRIGINVGDIIIDGGDIFGDGVNIAARLETLAEPGGICVSQTVHDQVRNKLAFGFEDLGDKAVKNIALPVHVYAVRSDAQALLSGTAPAPVTPVSAQKHKRAPALLAALAFVGVSAVAAVSLLWLRGKAEPPVVCCAADSGPANTPGPGAQIPARPIRAASPPPAQTPSPGPAESGRPLSADDAARLTQVASDRGFQPPKFAIDLPKPEVPAALHKYVGVWMSDIGMNGGKGRYAMLYVNAVDERGVATGYLMFAPGAPGTADVRPAFTSQFAGTISDDRINGATGSVEFLAKPGPGKTIFLTMLLKDNQTSRNILKPLWLLTPLPAAAAP